MKYVIDSHAWINYFEGNLVGHKIKEIIEDNNNEIITNVLNFAEMSSFFSRKNIELDKLNEALRIIVSLSKVYNFDADFSNEAGLLHAEMKKLEKNFGLIDAFVLLTARKLKAKVITCDYHFTIAKEAIIIK